MTLYAVPTPLIALFVFGFTFAGLELGRHLGGKSPHLSDEASSALGIIKNAVLGLLALLLAFSFSLASSRYDARRELVVQEANAIGTAYLRADLLEDDLRGAYAAQLRDYLDTRIAFSDVGFDQARIHETDVQLARLQAQLWRTATEQARLHPDDTHAAIIESLNFLFDTSAARNAARTNEVPPPILTLLLVFVFISALFAGHSFGLARHRDLLSSACFSILVAVVLFVVLDLDRPRRGFIRESQKPMLDLRASMSR